MIDNIDFFILKSIRNKDLESFKKFRDFYSFGTMISCCASGLLHFLEHLVFLGYDVRENEDHLLKIASIYNHIEIVKYLISQGAKNINQAVLSAAEFGNLEIVKYLLSLGANIRDEDDYALRLACINGHIQVVKYIIKISYGDIDIKKENNMLLKFAMVNENYELVEYLVSNGAPYDLLSNNFKRYVDFFNKMKHKIRHRAAKKIYYWIIPKLYAPGSVSAYNLGMKGYLECFGN